METKKRNEAMEMRRIKIERNTEDNREGVTYRPFSGNQLFSYGTVEVQSVVHLRLFWIQADATMIFGIENHTLSGIMNTRYT